jgi:hypothetical protein
MASFDEIILSEGESKKNKREDNVANESDLTYDKVCELYEEQKKEIEESESGHLDSFLEMISGFENKTDRSFEPRSSKKFEYPKSYEFFSADEDGPYMPTASDESDEYTFKLPIKKILDEMKQCVKESESRICKRISKLEKAIEGLKKNEEETLDCSAEQFEKMLSMM